VLAGKRIIALSMAVGVLAAANLTTATDKLDKPLNATIDFTEHKFDFGFMPNGSSAMHTYYIENKGVDTLRIIKVTPSCGCTSAPLSKSDIAPGEVSSLDVIFDSGKFMGRIEKKVTIMSNDPVDPVSDVYFSAMVDKPHPMLSATPSVVDGTPVSGNKTATSFKVKITNTGAEPLELKVVDGGEPYLDAKLSRDRVPAGQSVDLVVKYKSPHGSLKKPWYSVTVETNDPQKQRLTIPLFIPTS
jgi:hypothetical protein